MTTPRALPRTVTPPRHHLNVTHLRYQIEDAVAGAIAWVRSWESITVTDAGTRQPRRLTRREIRELAAVGMGIAADQDNGYGGYYGGQPDGHSIQVDSLLSASHDGEMYAEWCESLLPERRARDGLAAIWQERMRAGRTRATILRDLGLLVGCRRAAERAVGRR